MHARFPLVAAPLLTLALLLSPGTAFSLAPDDHVAIEARALVDLDGRLLPQTPLSNLLQAETTEPFGRSVVAVSDSQAGLFSTFASADIGNLALKVSGSLTNSTAAQYFGQGVPILQAVAEARDAIVLNTSRTDPFDITVELQISGELAAGAGSSAGANSLLKIDSPGKLGVFDAGNYSVGASGTTNTIADVLSATLTVSGPSVTVNIESLLSFSVLRLAAGESATGDLSNSAYLVLILPEDVTIASSSSGTFGVPMAPIPEPSTAAMSILGLAAVAGAIRARRRR